MRAITFISSDRVTQAEFAEFADWVGRIEPADLHRYELLDGFIVREPPAGWQHGEVEANIVAVLRDFVRPRRLGRVFGSSPGFELPTGDTIEPDAAFVSERRWAACRPGKRAWPRVVPDLLVEILSPGSQVRDRQEKKRIYERSGVREYWLVDPEARQVTVFFGCRAGFGSGVVVTESGVIVSRVLDGLRLAASEIFPEPE